MRAARIHQPGKREVTVRYRELLDHLPVGVYRTTEEGQIVECNRALARMLGYGVVDELCRVRVPELYVRPADRVTHLGSPAAETGEPAEHELKRKDGGTLWVRDYCRVSRDSGGKVRFYDGIIVDITEEREARETIRALALHDPLTGLPNRKLLYDRLGVAMAQARRNRRMLALMYLDLDGFKAVNDTRGHAAGDVLLIALARRLQGALRVSDTVGRMGGDEFIVLVPEVPGREGAEELARKILAEMRKPVPVDGDPVSCSASLGLALYSGDGETMDMLLRRADAAMYRAKGSGKDRYVATGEPPTAP